MIRYLLVTMMIMLTPPKGSGGLPHAPRSAVVEARVWDKLAAALSFVESRDDDRAYNATSGALGRWQMKKVYVDEVNRILCLKREKRRYRYEDRTNPVKAREMFEIYQSHHNPKKDIDWAIRLHRGLHSPKYIKSVRAESIMSVIKRSDNGKSAEVYDIDELKNNWNHWVRTGEILFTPGNGKW